MSIEEFRALLQVSKMVSKNASKIVMNTGKLLPHSLSRCKITYFCVVNKFQELFEARSMGSGCDGCDIGFCQYLQVEPTQSGPTDTATVCRSETETSSVCLLGAVEVPPGNGCRIQSPKCCLKSLVMDNVRNCEG
jgi:hypothetical protein